MSTQTSKPNDWWHERPTKSADLGTRLAPVCKSRRESDSVWFKAAVTVGLVLALGLSLIGLLGR
jgi:hypothetical protein